MKKALLIVAAGTLAFGASAAYADVSTETQDLNGDGVVTFEEFVDSHAAGIARTQAFLDRHRGIFDAADTNGDGVVDQSESQGGATGKVKAKNTKKS
ncbi:EF-hand domain-containing protein [Leisingera sp. M658]|uniref:EF-hand domain-containing protein n=1 Tax=Leisingera sp. M658 TaxID=2867015 RepID=UPI0021A7E295|nr:EF-hand domain-containing protein [Leisingera sp. M658]UWQ74155.1 EF-hand domain-containing protein [Leisingera sp. M658]